uniref:Complement component C9 n=1 Tax=Pogona vitticeps TaxID=103695 RepID=A0ABM5FU52_9SAUR
MPPISEQLFFSYFSIVTKTSTMSTFFLLIGALFILGTNSFYTEEKSRVRREPNAPTPIDCLLSAWSEWGPCNPCARERYRSRSVLRYGQFGGRMCHESLGHRESCVPDTPCLEEQPDCGKDFQCDSGQCIKSRLVCNTEDDCGDLSDEAECENERPPPCRDRIIDVSELGRIAGRGINILGMQPRANAFHNEFFNGMCDRVRDGNTGIYYRKPWNVAVLNYETSGEKNFRSEYYEDQVTSVKELLSQTEHTFEASLSLKLTPTETKDTPTETKGFSSIEPSLTISSSGTNSVSTFLNESKGKKKTFLHVKSSIQLGSFIMRTRDVRLNDVFLEDLKYLPTEYEKGEYFKFLETYGTHYARRGTYGGIYELLYILDDETMSKEGITKTDVKNCLGFTAGVAASASGMDVNANIKDNKCKTEQMKNVDNSSGNTVVNGVLSQVKGGKTDVLVRLKEMLSTGQKVIDVENYVQWAATLPDAPAVISQEASPISTLVPSKMPDAEIKKRNLDRAVEDYVAEYSVCKCQPCQNGGTVMLLNGKCECGCTAYFKGDACEIPAETLASAPVINTATDGSWSCWSSWSACQQGKRTRTRLCNNPAPGNGGKPCAGANSEPGYCSDRER